MIKGKDPNQPSRQASAASPDKRPQAINLTARAGRRLATGLALACSAIMLPAAAQAASSAPGAPARPAAAAARCTGGAGHTEVWLAEAGNGAAGTSFFELEFSNTGRRACTLHGLPPGRGHPGRPSGRPARRPPARARSGGHAPARRDRARHLADRRRPALLPSGHDEPDHLPARPEHHLLATTTPRAGLPPPSGAGNRRPPGPPGRRDPLLHTPLSAAHDRTGPGRRPGPAQSLARSADRAVARRHQRASRPGRPATSRMSAARRARQPRSARPGLLRRWDAPTAMGAVLPLPPGGSGCQAGGQ